MRTEPCTHRCVYPLGHLANLRACPLGLEIHAAGMRFSHPIFPLTTSSRADVREPAGTQSSDEENGWRTTPASKNDTGMELVAVMHSQWPMAPDGNRCHFGEEEEEERVIVPICLITLL